MSVERRFVNWRGNPISEWEKIGKLGELRIIYRKNRNSRWINFLKFLKVQFIPYEMKIVGPNAVFIEGYRWYKDPDTQKFRYLTEIKPIERQAINKLPFVKGDESNHRQQFQWV